MNIRKDLCENCHKSAKKQFRIIEPGVLYSINGSDERVHLVFRFCTPTCAKSFAAWMFAPGLTTLPKGWRVEQVVEKTEKVVDKKKAKSKRRKLTA